MAYAVQAAYNVLKKEKKIGRKEVDMKGKGKQNIRVTVGRNIVSVKQLGVASEFRVMSAVQEILNISLQRRMRK